MGVVDEKYVALLHHCGISLTVELDLNPDSPLSAIAESNGGFVIRLNPAKFLPDVSLDQYLGYYAGCLLLPQLRLETKRLLLRRCVPEDACDCFDFLSDEAGCLMDCSKAFSSMDDDFYARITLFTEREQQYMVVLKDSSKVIGTVNLFSDESRAVSAMEIGYSISPAYRRMGYAYEALSAIIQLLWDLQQDMVVARVLRDNEASIALLRKLGFQHEGFRRKAVWHEGLNHPVDLESYYLEKP